MSITVRIIESNERRSGMAYINGVDVDLGDLVIHGTDKQVAWARDIAKQLIASGVKRAVDRNQSGLVDAAELDSCVEKINAMYADLTAKLSGKLARTWIDTRDLRAVAEA